MKSVRTVLFLWTILAMSQKGFAVVKEDHPEVIQECKSCHEMEVRSYGMTGHGKTNVACSACHGDPKLHLIDSLAKDKIMKPSDLSPYKSQELCLQCHRDKGKDVEERFTAVMSGHENLHCFDCHTAHLKKGASAEEEYQLKESTQVKCGHCHKNIIGQVEHSPHGRADISCSECHAVHQIENVSRSIEKEIEYCLKCHPAQELEFQSPSRHPLRERQITCTGCHDPHSDRFEKMLRKEPEEQMCGECHGDILIEGGRHPVSKDTNHTFGSVHCTDCHHPHGSNFEAVLVQPSEELCNTCHTREIAHHF